jgi:hypothetical protein
MGPDEVEIGACERGIMVVTASVVSELEAVGAWDYRILTSRHLIEQLLARTSRPTVKLLFVGLQLFIDRLPVSAADLAPDEGFSSQRPRRSVGRPHQRSLPLPEPAKLRARAVRPQVFTEGLPLFGR